MYAYLTSFSMEKLKAGRDRENFSDLEGLWQPSSSGPFYCTVMSLNRFKLLILCFHFDNWHMMSKSCQISLQLYPKCGTL